MNRIDAEAELTRLRDAIDRVDEVIVKLLNQRAKYASRSARSKPSSSCRSTPPSARSRCSRMPRDVNAGPLDPSAVRRLFERIIDESRRVERHARIGQPDRGRERSNGHCDGKTHRGEQHRARHRRAHRARLRRPPLHRLRTDGPRRRRRRRRARYRASSSCYDGVQEVVRISEPYKLSSRTWRKEKTIVQARGVDIGGDRRRRHGRPVHDRERAVSSSRPRAAWRGPARACCAAAPTSRAPRRMPFRAWAWKD